MPTTIDIRYTATFSNITDDLINYLSAYTSELGAIDRVTQLIEKFEHRVSANPYSCQISQPLFDQGVSMFREYNHDSFRLLYRVMESDQRLVIQADALLSQKQDIQQALVNYCLIHK
jgi:Plasmid stabilisation system protein.